MPLIADDPRPYRRTLTLLGFSVLVMALAVLVVGWMLDVAVVRSVFGRRAARLDGDDSPSRQVVIAPPLVERGSGELAPW